jgi:hypothetical protein
LRWSRYNAFNSVNVMASTSCWRHVVRQSIGKFLATRRR